MNDDAPCGSIAIKDVKPGTSETVYLAFRGMKAAKMIDRDQRLRINMSGNEAAQVWRAVIEWHWQGNTPCFTNEAGDCDVEDA